jgi:hypothetical protein
VDSKPVLRTSSGSLCAPLLLIGVATGPADVECELRLRAENGSDEPLATIKIVKESFCHVDWRRKPASMGVHRILHHGTMGLHLQNVYRRLATQIVGVLLQMDGFTRCCETHATSSQPMLTNTPKICSIIIIDELVRIGRTVFIQSVDHWVRLHV